MSSRKTSENANKANNFIGPVHVVVGMLVISWVHARRGLGRIMFVCNDIVKTSLINVMVILLVTYCQQSVAAKQSV